MGCNCPGKPGSYSNARYGLERPDFSFRQRDECDEHFMNRVEGDPLPQPPAVNKIENSSLAFACDLTINEQLRMTGPEEADTWVMEPSTDWFYDENGALIPEKMALFTSTGKIEGAIQRGAVPRVYNITIKAYKNGVLLDSKPFTVTAQRCGDCDSIILINPLPGSVITSRCSAERVHPVSGQPRPHKGVDLAYPGGAVKPVVAAADGIIITRSFEPNGYGNYVIIEHRGCSGNVICRTRYAHLASVSVSPGQKVQAGQPIGVEGNTGVGTAAHLHFEVRGPGDEVWDPEPMISGKRQITSAQKPTQPPPGSSPPASPQQPAVVAATETRANNPCRPAGPTTAPETVPSNVPDTDCSDIAFEFTMLSEVGPGFDPSDPDVVSGCRDCSAKRARLKCGQIMDEGGLTKFGVAAKFNGQATVENLDLETAKRIFKERYYQKSGADQLKTNGVPSCPKACLVVSTYFHSPNRLLNILKALTGTQGQAAIEILNQMSDEEFIEKFSAARLNEMKRAKTWVKYAKGFSARISQEKARARRMV